MNQMPVTTLTFVFNTKFLETKFTKHFLLLSKVLNFFMCRFYRSLRQLDMNFASLRVRFWTGLLTVIQERFQVSLYDIYANSK